MDLGNLAIDWLKSPPIRELLKPPKEGPAPVLFAKEVNESVRAACVPHVYDLLQDILVRVAQVGKKPQPVVEPLRQEIAELYRRSGVISSDDQIVHDSWMVRKFCSLIKVKVRLQKVSTATHLNIYMFSYLSYIFDFHYIYLIDLKAYSVNLVHVGIWRPNVFNSL